MVLYRVIDGIIYGLKWGMVGIGSNNSRGEFDNVVVQKLPPTYTLNSTEDFSDGVANLFTGTRTGTWQVQNSVYSGNPVAGSDYAINLMNLGLPHGLLPNSILDLSTIVNTQSSGGLVYDAYGPNDFKFVTLDAQADQVIIGHHTERRGWVQDAVVPRVINTGTDYTLGVSLKGTTVSVSVGGQVV